MLCSALHLVRPMTAHSSWLSRVSRDLYVHRNGKSICPHASPAAPAAAMPRSKANLAHDGMRREVPDTGTAVACVGIDPDMGGAIALVTFDRDDTALAVQPAEGRDALVCFCLAAHSMKQARKILASTNMSFRLIGAFLACRTWQRTYGTCQHTSIGSLRGS